MNERPQSPEPPPATDLVELARLIGYTPFSVRNSSFNLERRLSNDNRFPRFHLVIEKEGDLIVKMSFHFDARPHSSLAISPKSSQELERIVAILDQESHLSAFCQKLRSFLRHHLFFGLAESLARYRQISGQEMSSKAFSRRRRRQLKKGTRARFLTQKYEGEDKDDL